MIPVRTFGTRAARRLVREVGVRGRRLRDRRRPPFALARDEVPDGPLARLVDPLPPLAADPALLDVTALYAQGWFDLLGSGWVPATRDRWGDAADWLADGESRRIWSLIDADHRAVAWDRDIRSGHRWDGRQWHRDVPIVGPAGTDIKVPWELGRLQHLPQLALAGHYGRTLLNHLLDFIAVNPPAFGVQWASTMDVGIRVANLLLAWDLLRGTGVAVESTVEEIVRGSVYDHALHISENLEWNSRWRGNHYLADLCGLAWASAYLPPTPRTDAWLAFAFGELARELPHQFDLDGVNTEGSTSYHRLSGEMLCWTAALGLAVPAARLERLAAAEEHAPRVPGRGEALRVGIDRARVGRLVNENEATLLGGIARFTREITRPDGRVVQVGDNDSGRFVKVRPAWVALTVDEATDRYANLAHYEGLPAGSTYWWEDSLDHGHVVRAIDVLTGQEPARDAETAVLSALARTPLEPLPQPRRHRLSIGAAWPAERLLRLDRSHCRRRIVLRPGGPDLTAAMEHKPFTGFGLYLWRSPRLFLSVRCGPLGQAGLGGHNHNDQLALEVVIDGRIWLQERGTLTYTADPDVRNRYRSVTAHSSPRLDGAEPWRLDEGLFLLAGDARGGVPLWLHEYAFAGEHRGYGDPVVRVVRVATESIAIDDYLPRRTGGARTSEELVVTGPEQAEAVFGPFPPLSPGYGWVEKT